MLYTVIKKNSYQDSINLMLLTKKLSSMPRVDQISVMMGTPANKDIFRNSGLYTPELEEAGANDICVVIDTGDETLVDTAMEAIESFLKDQSVASKENKIKTARTWQSALEKLPNANVALISIAGEYAAEEADKALDLGLNVMIFSDNVTVEDELKLKQKAHEKGLLVMGPDCGTSIISGVPLAFANAVPKGDIGLVGASGTGLQEVSSIIGRLGYGVSQAIGTGGRDLSSDIGGITALDAIEILKNDDDTKVITFISKPPADEVRDKIIVALKKVGKPVVAIFLGNPPREPEENITYAWTLEETAILAANEAEKVASSIIPKIEAISKKPKARKIKGIYSGGTLAGEAAMIMSNKLGIPENAGHAKGVMLNADGHMVVDMGDDFYTKGHPHPMIDPTQRIELIKEQAKQEDTAIILLDFVIGYGGHKDIVSEFTELIENLEAETKVIFIASVTGTESDPQVYSTQVETLKKCGCIVASSNAKATELALWVLNTLNNPQPAVKYTPNTNAMLQEVDVINMGISYFSDAIFENGGGAVNYMWNPAAGGNKELQKILKKLYEI